FRRVLFRSKTRIPGPRPSALPWATNIPPRLGCPFFTVTLTLTLTLTLPLTLLHLPPCSEFRALLFERASARLSLACKSQIPRVCLNTILLSSGADQAVMLLPSERLSLE